MKEGFVDLLIASLRPALEKRDGTITGLVNDANNVKTAFSSWDNCMQATICKYVQDSSRPGHINPHLFPYDANQHRSGGP